MVVKYFELLSLNPENVTTVLAKELILIQLEDQLVTMIFDYFTHNYISENSTSQ